MGAVPTTTAGGPPPRVPRGTGPRRRPSSSTAGGSRRRTGPAERVAIGVVAGAAAVVAATAPARPTSYLVTDCLWQGAFAAVLVLATSRARRWTWLVLAGLATVGVAGSPWQWAGLAALAVAAAATVLTRRRIYGAVIGALAAQPLLRIDDVGFSVESAVLAVVAVLPVFLSAYLVSPARIRRQIHLGLVVVGGVAVVGALLAGLAGLLALGPADDGVRLARSGLEAARDGRADDAANDLRLSSTAFAESGASVQSWWASAGGGVPVVAQHLDAARVLTEQGELVAAAAARALGDADLQSLRYEDGAFDVARLAALQAPLADAAGVLATAEDEVDAVRSPWLVPPVAGTLDSLEAELSGSRPEVELAAVAAREGPTLLGAGAAKHYLVLFTQPAESRGLSGFVGNWAELTALEGRVEMTANGRAADVNDAPGRDARRVTAPPAPLDYVERYSRFQPGYFFQDVTLAPDLPSVAAAAAQVYGEARGTRIDGVLVVDPVALAALLEFTGPIRVDGLPEPLTARNAAELLLRGQYTELADEARVDLLDQATERTFDALVSGSLPSPREVGATMSPVVEQGRIGFWAFDTGSHELIDRLGLDRRLPPPDGGDFFQLVTQNKANNKIDVFLHREVDYEVAYAPDLGSVEATARITLRNDAPASGLPEAVIGSNDQGLPLGTNRAYVSFYSALGLREARVDGQPTPVEYQRELGRTVLSRYVDIPPGGSVEIDLALFGSIDVGPRYDLTVGHQALVEPDSVRVRVRPVGEFEVDETTGLVQDTTGANASVELDLLRQLHLSATMGRP